MNFKAVNVSPMEKVFSTAAPSEEGAREKTQWFKRRDRFFSDCLLCGISGLCQGRGRSNLTHPGTGTASKVALVPCEYPWPCCR